jgi:hypothetical protein
VNAKNLILKAIVGMQKKLQKKAGKKWISIKLKTFPLWRFLRFLK